jgi:hypothetical protein
MTVIRMKDEDERSKWRRRRKEGNKNPETSLTMG